MDTHKTVRAQVAHGHGFSRWRIWGGSGGILLMLLILFGLWHGWSVQAQPLPVYGTAPAFALTDQLKRPVTSNAFHGKVIVANFVYTTCTDICPTLSGHMLVLQERLRQEQMLGSAVQLLSFTVDPAWDTPAVLRAYAERHHADPNAWRFLTGPEEVLKPLIVDGFHLGVQVLPPASARPHQHGERADAATSYAVMHSGRFILIDQRGHIRAYYDGQEFNLERVVGDIRQLPR